MEDTHETDEFKWQRQCMHYGVLQRSGKWRIAYHDFGMFGGSADRGM
jgi:hypothetical protein